MKKCIFLAGAIGSASAFTAPLPKGKYAPPSSQLFSSLAAGVINVDETMNFQRDVFGMENWAIGGGCQKADGFELTSFDGQDWSVQTNQDIAAGSPVLFVPNEMIISSSKVAQEYGQAIASAEQQLAQGNLQDQIPLFRIFFKILVEYEKGQGSPYFQWLNSLPRFYNNGASMTTQCFDCLPPYAGWLAMTERTNSINFRNALKFAPVLSEATVSNESVLKWAFNVATTRSINRNGEKLIAPLADMFNHGADPEVEISLDQNGNVMAYAANNIPAGSPLRMSLGDPRNPSPLFATYGFLDESAPATFCKTMDMLEEMEELGYGFVDLLFQKETGEISPQVYDLFLYSVLKQEPNLKQDFYEACMRGDENAKQEFHNQYFPYTLEAMKNHVDKTLRELDDLSNKASSMDPRTHPRASMIYQHNQFVKQTFMNVKANLDRM
eukprot:CAMPEP_0197440126 /NCGR_PEP_ID=MMETSP1175-20131217/6702_1 /TAXON_ID=1003142 /ORGANISM="Triceratium dubium, Strain CCMP147" /LENGTH=438 /DNA_ID=CAMNT_0042970173 /DNA_START=63 /DNA_END=1379 /DNA_ORIENTATION=+